MYIFTLSEVFDFLIESPLRKFFKNVLFLHLPEESYVTLFRCSKCTSQPTISITILRNG